MLVTEASENTAGCLVTRNIPRKNIWKCNDRRKGEELNCLPLVRASAAPYCWLALLVPSRQLLGIRAKMSEMASVA